MDCCSVIALGSVLPTYTGIALLTDSMVVTCSVPVPCPPTAVTRPLASTLNTAGSSDAKFNGASAIGWKTMSRTRSLTCRLCPACSTTPWGPSIVKGTCRTRTWNDLETFGPTIRIAVVPGTPLARRNWPESTATIVVSKLTTRKFAGLTTRAPAKSRNSTGRGRYASCGSSSESGTVTEVTRWTTVAETWVRSSPDSAMTKTLPSGPTECSRPVLSTVMIVVSDELKDTGCPLTGSPSRSITVAVNWRLSPCGTSGRGAMTIRLGPEAVALSPSQPATARPHPRRKRRRPRELPGIVDPSVEAAGHSGPAYPRARSSRSVAGHTGQEPLGLAGSRAMVP